jgi:hypothetical protein
VREQEKHQPQRVSRQRSPVRGQRCLSITRPFLSFHPTPIAVVRQPPATHIYLHSLSGTFSWSIITVSNMASFGPSLVVVPASPMGHQQPFSGPRPSPTSTVTTSTSTRSTSTTTGPDTPRRLSAVDLDGPRESTESSVFSIYDMYGRPGSWSANEDSSSYTPHRLSTTVAAAVDLRKSNGFNNINNNNADRPLSKLATDFYVPTPRSTQTSTTMDSSARSSGLVYSLDGSSNDSHVTPPGRFSSQCTVTCETPLPTPALVRRPQLSRPI